MEKKKTKNKFMLAICAMCVAFLGVVGALVGVLAASTQTIGSNFNVSYSIGENVAIAFGAVNEKGGEEADPPAWWTATGASKNNKGFYVVNANESQDLGVSYLPQNINLEGITLINFYFENITDKPVELTIENRSVISPTIGSDYTWLTHEVNLPEEDISEFSFKATLGHSASIVDRRPCYPKDFEIKSETVIIDGQSTQREYSSITFEIPAGGINSFEVAVFLKNVNFDANYAGNFSFIFRQPSES